jgi:hypothetical protein
MWGEIEMSLADAGFVCGVASVTIAVPWHDKMDGL